MDIERKANNINLKSTHNWQCYSLEPYTHTHTQSQTPTVANVVVMAVVVALETVPRLDLQRPPQHLGHPRRHSITTPTLGSYM